MGDTPNYNELDQYIRKSIRTRLNPNLKLDLRKNQYKSESSEMLILISILVNVDHNIYLWRDQS